MTEPPSAKIAFSAACKHDAAEIAALARTRMPRMKYLHDEAHWTTAYRYGCGQYPLDNYLVTGRAENDKLVAFLWADAAMWTDHGLIEPWWFINALCVEEAYAGRGIGKMLVRHLESAAAAAGVVSLYGVCYPESAKFWQRVGYEVTEPGGAIEPDQQVRHRDRGLVTVPPIADEEGDHMFVRSRISDSAGGSARLIISPGNTTGREPHALD